MQSWEVDRIEARLGVSLPPEYRAFIENYPIELANAAGYEIVDQVDFVVNETIRQRLTAEPEIGWSHDNVVIGHSGCGDYYYLDLTQLPSPVMCINHEAEGPKSVASSFIAFVQMVSKNV